MPDDYQEKKKDSHFPPDVAVIGGCLFVIMAVVYVSCGLSWAKTRGDTTLFNLALFLGGIGAELCCCWLPGYHFIADAVFSRSDRVR